MDHNQINVILSEVEGSSGNIILNRIDPEGLDDKPVFDILVGKTSTELGIVTPFTNGITALGIKAHVNALRVKMKALGWDVRVDMNTTQAEAIKYFSDKSVSGYGLFGHSWGVGGWQTKPMSMKEFNQQIPNKFTQARDKDEQGLQVNDLRVLLAGRQLDYLLMFCCESDSAELKSSQCGRSLVKPDGIFYGAWGYYNAWAGDYGRYLQPICAIRDAHDHKGLIH